MHFIQAASFRGNKEVAQLLLDQRGLIKALLEDKRENQLKLGHLDTDTKTHDTRISPDRKINQQSSKASGSEEEHYVVPGDLQQYFSLMRTVLAEIDAYQNDLDQTRYIRIRNGVVGVHSAEAKLFQNVHGRTASQLFDPFFNFREAPIPVFKDTPTGTIVGDDDGSKPHEVERDSGLGENVNMPWPPKTRSAFRTPPSAAARLRVPPSGEHSRLNNSKLAPPPVILNKSKSSSKRVMLQPGFSPLDWAAISANPNNQLRGADIPLGLLRVTPSMLKVQNGRKGRDAWTSYQGKIYNISPYLLYHPGGKGELIRGAGKDSEHLFNDIHPWVNWYEILSECLVGTLVSEGEVLPQNSPTPDEGQAQLVDKINDSPNELDWFETGRPGGMQEESTEKEQPDSWQLEKHVLFERSGELMQKKEPPEKPAIQKHLDDAGDQVDIENNEKNAAQWILEWTTLTVEEIQTAI
ncbi:hypothetical protein N7475_007755 [Penicillium sp. IBT 31633x]|nr:hypothetical protein N7475_007755 [Penicillium sp. IBT 31633x]